MSAAGRAQKPFAFDPANGAVFGELDVARCYAHRPPYAPALYERLLELVPGRARALDLGCGPGKVALQLAPYFGEVVAVDPSESMLAAGQELSLATNIRWLQGHAEAISLGGPFDLITIGTAVHWMRHDVVFPRLCGWLGRGPLAIISSERNDNDTAWSRRWIAFLKDWLRRVGREYDPVGFGAAGQTYKSWMDIDGDESFVHVFRQSVQDFIALQHSTATFARAKLGPKLSAEFDRELFDALSPLSDQGVLSFAMRSNLVWGKPRNQERETAK